MQGSGKKVTEDCVSMIFVARTMVLPPQDQEQEQHQNEPDQIEAPKHALHCIPMPPEKVAHGGNGRHPDRSTEEVEQDEGFPGHSQNSGQGSGENTKAKNKSGQKNR